MSLRVGLVGAGNMAGVHADAWATTPDRIVAVFDPDRERASKLAAESGAVVADDFESLAGMVDVVDICAPTHTHASYIAAAADARVDIVCEKPLARTAAEARDAVAVCEAAGVRLLVGHVVRFFPEYAAARDAVVAGDIGSVGVVRLDRSTYLPAGASSWFSDRSKSGGVVLDLMIHDVDYARWVAGDVERVYARSAGGGDHVLATLSHTNGAISHIQASWAYPMGSFRAAFEIAGSDGLIQRHVAVPFEASVEASDDVSDVPQPPSSSTESPYITEIRHFSSVLHGSGEPRVTADDGARAVAICDGIAESLMTNRAVEVGP
ncbi:MAG: Gfo/Idh/MocA family oxidoreductase [Actinomycetia bacterium]|nr:Gfo/Idh/MocA family oxidoreductase [Actinomycetes bacterium]